MALPILSAWKDCIPTHSENLKTCRVFSSLHGKTVQVLRQSETAVGWRWKVTWMPRRHVETCTVVINQALSKKNVKIRRLK